MTKPFACILCMVFFFCASAQVSIKTDTFSFAFEGKKLTGLLDYPIEKQPTRLILLIPGSGKTNMAEGNGYYKRLRTFFVSQGMACCVWDKPGCGKSEGIYDDEDLSKSAQEAIACIQELKRQQVPGADSAGLWSLSRGGWVCPLIIQNYPSIAFWISVSGPDSEETFGYLLERNFRIEGRSKKQTKKLMQAWYSHIDIARHGGTFEEHQKTTEPLRSDPFYKFITGNSPLTNEGYLKWQKGFEAGTNMPVNEKTGLQVYFPGFDTVLSHINCPVLAVFGEKDSQVNWQKTKKLYSETIGKNTPATLTVKTFADGNHNLFKCETGGFREKLEKIAFCDGYLESISAWLKENKFR